MPTTITPLSTPPSRDDRANFAARGDVTLSELPVMVTEINTVIGELNTLASSTTGSTAADVIAAAASATASENSRLASEAASNATKWISGTTYPEGTVVWSPITYFSYRRKSTGGGTTDPSLDSANWALLVPNSQLFRSARTSNTMLGTADRMTLVDITSGTFTQTFDNAASLGDGWWLYIRNTGTGDITLDPASSETIDGLTSYVMYPGEARWVQCDGIAFRTMVLRPFYRTFTTSGTFTKPPGYSMFGGRIWSGGNSGQRTNSTSTASIGGGGGGCVDFLQPSSSFGTTETVTIGSGGTAVTTVASGNLGSNTSIGSVVVAYAALAAQRGGSIMSGLVGDSTSSADGFAGAAGGNTTTPCNSVYGGSASATTAQADSGSAVYGGAAGGSVDGAGVIRAPGTSTYGGNGGAAAVSTNGTAGTAPGGGGGATQTGTQSGAGARGEVRIWGAI